MFRYFLVTIFILILDQWSKWLVLKKMSIYDSIPIIDSFFYITSHRNEGAAFGILQRQQWLFIAITIIVASMIIYYLWNLKDKCPWTSIAFSFILGGAIGNFIDRVSTGKVVDFFHFQFGSYQFPIFNIADTAIVIGVFLITVITLFTKEKEPLSVVRDFHGRS